MSFNRRSSRGGSGLGLAINTKGFTTTTYGGTPSLDVGLSHSAGWRIPQIQRQQKSLECLVNSGLVFLISFLLSIFFKDTSVGWQLFTCHLGFFFQKKKMLLLFVFLLKKIGLFVFLICCSFFRCSCRVVKRFLLCRCCRNSVYWLLGIVGW